MMSRFGRGVSWLLGSRELDRSDPGMTTNPDPDCGPLRERELSVFRTPSVSEMVHPS